MKYINEFTDKEVVKMLMALIAEKTELISRQVKLMEVCGSHTMSIGKSGIRSLLPENLKLLSGPGCPVCVTPAEYITASIKLAQMKDTRITTFGDMVRVPNSEGRTLDEFSSDKVKIVYTPLEAIDLAQQNPDKNIIFLGVGFETTTPVVGQTIKIAKEKKLNNFFCLSAHKLIPPALKALTLNPASKIDGFILPGHVSVMLGRRAYDSLGIRGVTTGFEPTDILESVNMLLLQISEDRMVVENQYKRAVTEEGNLQMQKVVNEVFEEADTPWRGLSSIPLSGLVISPEYADYDAAKKFNIDFEEESEPAGCRCGEVLQGICIPFDCGLFVNKCNPNNPIGPCMVSSEGACSAYYKYER